MPKQIKQRPATRYRPVGPTPRYEVEREAPEERRREVGEVQPRLGPYEFRYPVEHGYTALSRFH